MVPVDLHEKRQLDLAAHVARVNEHVAKVKAHARPWRSILAAVVAIAAGAVASLAGTDFKDWSGRGHYVYKIVAAAPIAAFSVFGTVAVVGLAGRARQVLIPAVGSAHAAVVRYAILLVGGATILVLGIGLMKVPIRQVLVGGQSPRSCSGSRGSSPCRTYSPASSCCCRGRSLWGIISGSNPGAWAA